MEKFVAVKIWYDEKSEDSLISYRIIGKSNNKEILMTKYTPNYKTLGFDKFIDNKEDQDGIVSTESDFINYIFDLEAFIKNYNTPCNDSKDGIKKEKAFENLSQQEVLSVKKMIDNNEITNRYFIVQMTIELENKDEIGTFRYELKEQADTVEELIPLYRTCSITGEYKPVDKYPEGVWCIDCEFSNSVINTEIYLDNSNEGQQDIFNERYEQFITELNRKEILNKV